mmetsp:Transcript_25691/g.102478  ORF Transcript_25691/g.102478 Transcript_25691/m.102478 type:complete len:471 (+) Transcript_25691:621-2033(+)
MQSDSVPLFKNFETYVASMPMRRLAETGQYHQLCSYPYWARPEDINDMAGRLERNAKEEYTLGKSPDIRALVWYISGPSGSGKTVSVLPAFLASAEKDGGVSGTGGFTHYLYLACANNGKRNFCFEEETLSNSKRTAEAQGAFFMLECLKLLVDAELRQHILDSDGDPPAQNETQSAMIDFFNRTFPNGKVLVHIDEHRKMCMKDDMPAQSAAFRRGAMTTLAGVPQVTAVSTYTAIPDEVPPEGSSEVCRGPLVKPWLDVDDVVKDVDELSFPADPEAFNREQQRLWSTLRFRLVVALPIGLQKVHERTPGATRFLREFQIAAQQALTANSTGVTQALKDCVRVAALQDSASFDPNPNAARLLLGVPDNKQNDVFTRQVADLVIANNGKSDVVTASLMTLLYWKDPTCLVYGTGRDRLRVALMYENVTDYLSATPLEAAYAWTLSCFSARDGEIKFTKNPPTSRSNART